MGSYHYTNHEVTNELCRKWCNPAPTNSSSLNSIVVAHDKKGNPYYKRAFNTQVCVLFTLGLKPLLTFFYIKACKQLNSWLNGFQSILKCMTPGNFDWFSHIMHFYHTRNVLTKQKKKEKYNNDDDGDD